MVEDQDPALVRACQAGDTRAFETLVDRYLKTILNVVQRMVKNHDDAEDITQTVFIKVYENLQGIDLRQKFFSWLYRIAVNEALNFIRRQKRTTRLEGDFAANGSTPEEAFVETEFNDQIQDSLMKLDPENRGLIVLKHLQNCSYQEMAYIMDIPEKTVKSRLYSARQLLKGILVQSGIFENE